MDETSSTYPAHLWYAVHCQAFKERHAAVALQTLLGLATYLPEIKQRFRGTVQYAPLFPGYVFIYADLGEIAPSKINTTPGVLRLVAFNDVARPIPAVTIQAIRQRVDDLNARGGLPQHQFHPGDHVSIKHGPLHGLEAIFVGPMTPRDRVRVLIDFLGQPSKAEVHVDMLEHANSAPMPKRERRTRGKGRHIMKKVSGDGNVAPELTS